MLETGAACDRWLFRGAERQEATTMIEQGSVVLERDVSELVAQVWIDYWHRLGWEVDGEPELVGVHHAGHRVLDYHLRPAYDGAVVPPVRAAYDLHALAVWPVRSRACAAGAGPAASPAPP